MVRVLSLLLLLLSLLVGADRTIYSNDAPNLLSPRNFTMVHLFEWSWGAVGDECGFLARWGYGAVQVSPPTEHLKREIDIDGRGRVDMPWYLRYQPVSHLLVSRSGDEAQFEEMCRRCNAVGVRVIVDVVLNHMAGEGQAGRNISSGGSFFNATANHEQFPNASLSAEHFNDFRCNGNIEGDDYRNNADRVRNCRLVSLVDLDHSNGHVRNVTVSLLNRMIAFGVAGFRFDASKHMHPADLEAIIDAMDHLREDVYGKGRRPFVVHEVIDKGGEAITVGEYVKLGRYTNFNFGVGVANALQSLDGKNAGWVSTLGGGDGGVVKVDG